MFLVFGAMKSSRSWLAELEIQSSGLVKSRCVCKSNFLIFLNRWIYLEQPSSLKKCIRLTTQDLDPEISGPLTAKPNSVSPPFLFWPLCSASKKWISLSSLRCSLWGSVTFYCLDSLPHTCSLTTPSLSIFLPDFTSSSHLPELDSHHLLFLI